MADASSDQQSSPWGQRRFVLAAAFVAVLVLAGLGLLIGSTGGNDEGGGPAAGQRGGEPSASATPRDPAESVCGLPAGRPEVPAVAPEAQWELVGTIAAPSAPAVGPGIEEGRRRLCFAHSPTGALFAAVNFVAVAGRSPNDPDVLRELTAPTPARDELLRQGSGSADPDFRLQVAGFRMSAYSASAATVDLAFRTSEQGSLLHMTLPLRWQRGDWKLVVASSTTPFVVESLENLSGYVPWSGA
jgi:hypothetical protein